MADGTDRNAISKITLNDRVIGTAILCAVISTTMFAKSAVIALFVVALTVVFLWFFERNERGGLRFELHRAQFLLLCFLAWGFVTCAWSPAARDAIGALSSTLAVSAAGFITVAWLSRQPARRIAHLAYWMVVGYLIGTASVLLILVFDQAPIEWVVSQFGLYAPGETTKLIKETGGQIRAHTALLNNSVAAIGVLLLPMLGIAWTSCAGWRRSVLVALLVVLAYAATFSSVHESTKLALVVAPIVLILACWLPRIATWFVASIFAAVVLLSVPMSRLAHDPLKLHEAAWLQRSAQHRIAIWADYAVRVHEAPILGAGVRAAKHLGDTKTPALVWIEGRQLTAAGHPHNGFLQIAFEMGLIGSVLITGAGLAVIFARDRSHLAKPIVLTTMVIGTLIVGLCWDVWSSWQISMFLLAASCIVIACKLAGDEETLNSDRS